MTEPITPEDMIDRHAQFLGLASEEELPAQESAMLLRGIFNVLTELYRLQYAIYQQGKPDSAGQSG